MAYPTADTLILGHTHLAWAYARRTGTLPIPPHGTVELAGQERHLLNPGSVGQSRSREREPHARVMLLDLDQRRATFHTVAYDVAACREDLRRQGLPTNAYHLHPTPLSGPTNRVRRLAKRALALVIRRRAAGST